MGYKVIELLDVTAEELERLINEWTKKGWSLDRVLFAMRETQRRPSMAFLIFFSDKEDDE